MPLPTFDSPQEVIDYAGGQLARAVADPKHPWHWPALSTAGPAARIVVLRSFARSKAALRFYTDARSAKVAQLAGAGGACELLFYHPRHRTQLRIGGTATPVAAEAERRDLWARQSDQGRRSYATERAPGTPLESAGDGLPPGFADSPTGEQLEAAFENFAVYDLDATGADFLQLGREGQRRCRWGRDWSAAEVRWVIP